MKENDDFKKAYSDYNPYRLIDSSKYWVLVGVDDNDAIAIIQSDTAGGKNNDENGLLLLGILHSAAHIATHETYCLDKIGD